MKKRRYVIFLVLALVLSLPAAAVFNEKNLSQTLSVLRFELGQEYEKMTSSETRLSVRDDSQHDRMVDMMKKCNELSLMLYSQNQDYTFDMTYALKEVSKEYEEFNESKMPYDEIILQLDVEIDRYTRLISSLERLPVPGRRSSFSQGQRPHGLDSLARDSLRRARALKDSLAAGPQRPARDSLDDQNRRQAFLLDSLGIADRDSCLVYAKALLEMYTRSRDTIISDNEHYENASERLKESYDYAQERYRFLQQKMFTQKQDSYISILSQPASYVRGAVEEVVGKYQRKEGDSLIRSEWRGPVVFGFLVLVLLALAASSILSVLVVGLLGRSRIKKLRVENIGSRKYPVTLLIGVAIFFLALAVVASVTTNNFIHQATNILLIFCWLLAAIVLSLVIRLDEQKVRAGIALYTPAILIGLIVITFRVMFIPNKMMNVLFPPLLIAFLVWQASVCRKHLRKMELSDEICATVTLAIFVVTAVMSLIGYVFVSLLVIIWWLFFLASAQTLIALYRIFGKVKERTLTSKVDAAKAAKGEYIRQSWLLDLIEKVALPVAVVASIPLSAYIALQVFDLQEIFSDVYNAEFFDLTSSAGNEILKVSASMIVVATSLFFVFRYISYFVRSMYRDIKYRRIKEAEGNRHIRANEVNLTLANNVISILTWGAYIVLIFLLFKIPTGAISVVFAGLATGIGLALKDVLNNFIYGIQLMSGRLRVGDWVECDGVRGKVTAISYQSTQIETTDGAVMSFLNAALFNKNFKNLTRNNPYEFVKIGVGVKYGSDVEQVREILSEAVATLQTKDQYGRKVVDEKSGVTVVFDDFGDNSVNLAVKQYVLVSQRTAYIARAKEVIYNALNENGIEIPFPQRDIHVIKD